MVDAMASKNKAPELIEVEPFETEGPLVSADYDWVEQDRVTKAIETVWKDKSDEMWWCLYKHIGDKRYAMTLVFDSVVNSKNVDVGDICDAIAMPTLCEPYVRHLPSVPGQLPASFSPTNAVDMKKFAGKPLYEIQIVVCEEAIRQMQSLHATEPIPGNDYRNEEPSHTFTAEEKAAFTKAVRRQIEVLRRTKKADWGKGPLGIYYSAWEPLTADIAMSVRNAHEKEKGGRGKGAAVKKG